MRQSSAPGGGKCPGLDPAAQVLDVAVVLEVGWVADHSFIRSYIHT